MSDSNRQKCRVRTRRDASGSDFDPNLPLLTGFTEPFQTKLTQITFNLYFLIWRDIFAKSCREKNHPLWEFRSVATLRANVCSEDVLDSCSVSLNAVCCSTHCCVFLHSTGVTWAPRSPVSQTARAAACCLWMKLEFWWLVLFYLLLLIFFCCFFQRRVKLPNIWRNMTDEPEKAFMSEY